MALFRLSHSTISNAKHDRGTAGARVRYIMRESASAEYCGDLPRGVELERSSVAHWIEREARYNERANGRVCEQFIVALPRELKQDGQPDLGAMRSLVEDFARNIGQGKIPWIASIHALGNDADQPHAHILVRNRDMDGHNKGRNVIDWFNKLGSVTKFREVWADCENRALENCGSLHRVDHRSREARGLSPGRTYLSPAEYRMRDRERDIAAARKSALLSS